MASNGDRLADKRRIVVAAGGTLDTALLPYRLVHLMARFDVCVAAAVSPGGLQFVTEAALMGVTGNIVYHEDNRFHPCTGLPLHIDYGDAEVLVVYPASARVVAQCAIGEVTCPVTRLFAFTPKERVVLAPALHPRMMRGLYEGHIEKLGRMGCSIIEAEVGSAWPEIEKEVGKRLNLVAKNDPGEMLQVGVRRNHELRTEQASMDLEGAEVS
jgi:phosphopantothenoylcysteine synthetase/decarboxylase